MLTLPKVYAITDRAISNLSHSEQVQQLADGSISLIQLREKHLAPAEWTDDAILARRIAREMGAMLIVNDRVDIAIAIDAVAAGASGVDLGTARRVAGEVLGLGREANTGQGKQQGQRNLHRRVPAGMG